MPPEPPEPLSEGHLLILAQERLARELGQLAAGVRALALIVILPVCLLPLGMLNLVPAFARVLQDMLPSTSLPVLTSLLFQGRPAWIALSALLPIGALATVILIRRHDIALYTLAIIAATASILWVLYLLGMVLPFISIVTTLSAP